MQKHIIIIILLIIPIISFSQPRLDVGSNFLSISNVIFLDGTKQDTAGLSANKIVTNLPDTLTYRNMSNEWTAAQTLPEGSTIIGTTFGLEHWNSSLDTSLYERTTLTTTNTTGVGLYIGTNRSVTFYPFNSTGDNSINLSPGSFSSTGPNSFRAASDNKTYVSGQYSALMGIAIDGNAPHYVSGNNSVWIGGGHRGGAGANIGAYISGSGSGIFAGHGVITANDSAILGSSISGGFGASITANNSASINSPRSTQSGGQYGTIIGGVLQEISSSGNYNNIFGGTRNVLNGGDVSAIVNGYYSTNSGSYSTLIGPYIDNAHNGVFAYNAFDGVNVGQLEVANSNVAIFQVSAFGINTNNPQADLHVAGEIRSDVGYIFPDGTTQTTAGVSGNTTVTNLPDTLVYRNISNEWLVAQNLPAETTVGGNAVGDVLLTNENIFTTTNIFNNRVGIGTNSPQSLLHVAGDIRLSGDIRAQDGTVALNPKGNYQVDLGVPGGAGASKIAQIRIGGTPHGGQPPGGFSTSSEGSVLIAHSAGYANPTAINGDQSVSIAVEGGTIIGSRNVGIGTRAYGLTLINGGANNLAAAGNNALIGTGVSQGSILASSSSSISAGNQQFAAAIQNSESSVSANRSVMLGGFELYQQADDSFISGRYITNTHAGNLIWHGYDGDTNYVTSATSNTVLFFTGGFGINTNDPQADLHVNGMIQIDNIKVYASGTNLYLTDGSTFTNLITTTPL